MAKGFWVSLLAVSALANVASPALADEADCSVYMGKKVAPMSIRAAMARFSGLTPKGEFETSVAYQARRAAAVGATGALIIEKPVERSLDGHSYVHYDADLGALIIDRWAFANAGFDFDAIFAAGGPAYDPNHNISFDAKFNGAVATTFEHTTVVTGAYMASNAFGARARVFRETRTFWAVFEKAMGDGDRRFFWFEDPKTSVVGEIKATPAEAVRLKPTLRLAFVVEPKEPYVVASTNHREPTLEGPFDTTTTTKVLFADFRCGLAMDGAGTVLGAWATK